MSLEIFSDNLSTRLAGFGHIVKFTSEEGDILVVDATQSPPAMSTTDADAEVALSASLQTFEGILNGTQDPNIAFMMGKLKVQGSMGLALKLNGVLES